MGDIGTADFDPQVPPEVLSKLVEAALSDPELPRRNPTEAFWQSPPSEVADVQSSQLPTETDYAIIGSGATGCSVAKNLIDNLFGSEASITVLEARRLCSGATGRNGGHLVSPYPFEYDSLEKTLGQDEATKCARFANRTLETIYALAGSDPELALVAEARRVRSVTGFWTREGFEEAKKGVLRYEEIVPDERGDSEIYESQERIAEQNMKDMFGTITHSAGAFWPYRLMTSLFARMLQRHEGRFSIETNTPVSSVTFDKATNEQYPYTLTTPRGTIRAKVVIHCTNGWTGHLLPNLRGNIFSLRGTMSTQAAGPDLPYVGDRTSWSTFDKPRYDPADGSFTSNFYYITQNANTGDVFVGGERSRPEDLLTSDDTKTSPLSEQNLRTILPKIFKKGWAESEAPVVGKLWSGVMGFTLDHMPLVGQLPTSVTDREGDGEWIAAGYNGMGMPLCWGCGEAVAKMVLRRHQEVQQWLPSSFLVTKERLEHPKLSLEDAIERFFGGGPAS